jgi:hypothetical protein
MMVLELIVSNQRLIRTVMMVLGSIMSESGAHSDSNDGFGVYRVRIRGLFGQ